MMWISRPWIETLGRRVLRVRLPRLLATAWWSWRPHVRLMVLPRVSPRFPLERKVRA